MIRRRPRFTVIRSATRRADIGAIARRELVVIPNKWVIFNCPCDTGHEIHLNLSSTRHPHWTIDTTDVSLYPSIVAAGPERRCHYFIVDDESGTVATTRQRRSRDLAAGDAAAMAVLRS